MDEVLGQRHSICPPVLRASLPLPGQPVVEPEPEPQPQPLEKEPVADEARGRGRKRGTPGDPTLMEFFKEQAVREQARQQASAERSERLINILELLIREK